jgi:hypothetical protein
MPERFPGRGGEHRFGWFTPCDQHGHAPQRGLLIGKLTEPCLVG